MAAVNPYRRHSKEMVTKLENAGLGYHMSDTEDMLGKVPMRQLVYRVKEMPPGLFSLVFDFGTLKDDTERKYIAQLIKTKAKVAPGITGYSTAHHQLIEDILQASQTYMRTREDECSFVSLRDVERTLDILQWFLSKPNLKDLTRSRLSQDRMYACGPTKLPDICLCIILATGVSYYVRLDEREDYAVLMSSKLKIKADLYKGVISACQDVFINELTSLGSTIAKNDALKENVWMMTICIELRIPLFLVGKPGSSKSLAKTVVATEMQGARSKSELFKTFKEIIMSSYQCSPQATAEGILHNFEQCQKLQINKDLSTFAAVCVLDEVGLAEDSPRMPLKTLHSLLEDGCIKDEERKPYKKVNNAPCHLCNTLRIVLRCNPSVTQ